MDGKWNKKRSNGNYVQQPTAKRLKKKEEEDFYDDIVDSPIPTDTLEIIFEKCSYYERFVLSKTTTFWYRLWNNKYKERYKIRNQLTHVDIHNYCAENNYDGLLTWAMCLGLHKSRITAITAVHAKNYDILFRLNELGFPIGSDIYTDLARCGNLDVIKQYYKILHVTPDPDLVKTAYRNGQSKIIEWMMENKLAIPSKLISHVVAMEDLKSLKWLYEKGYVPDHKQPLRAAKHNVTDILLEWFWDDLKLDLFHPNYGILYRDKDGCMKLMPEVNRFAYAFLQCKFKERSSDYFDIYYPRIK